HSRHLDRRPHRRSHRRRPGRLRPLGLRPEPHGLRPARRAPGARRRGDRDRLGGRVARGRRMTVVRWLRRAWPALLGIVALIVAVGLIWAWRPPSGYFVLWPDKAHAAADYLHIPGGKPPAPGTGFYFVDVHELEANKLEEFWGRHIVGGATLIPVREIIVPGESENQRVKEDFRAMDTSQVVAEAVAEKALGRNVVIRHLGALVEQVSPGLPAAKAGVEAGDVITAVDGHRVRAAADLIRFTRGLHPGDVAAYTFGPRRGTKRLRTVASTDGKHRAIIGVAIGDDVRIGRIPVKVHYTINGIGGPSAGLAFALEIYDSLSGRHLRRPEGERRRGPQGRRRQAPRHRRGHVRTGPEGHPQPACEVVKLRVRRSLRNRACDGAGAAASGFVDCPTRPAEPDEETRGTTPPPCDLRRLLLPQDRALRTAPEPALPDVPADAAGEDGAAAPAAPRRDGGDCRGLSAAAGRTCRSGGGPADPGW